MERGFVILSILGVCAAGRVPSHRSDTASIEIAYPHPVAMDRFEVMLQRASQILRSPPQVVEPTQESATHYQQPPREEHEYDNYYLPVYQSERNEKKLDPKSRQLQYMVPPAEDNQEANFYAIKQKKLPKKFLNAAKHINVKVIEDNQRVELPPQTRGYGNENNIVFDDVVFGVDAQAAVPEEVPQEHSTGHGFIAPIYSRRLPKSEDMFATSALKRESRMRGGFPMSRFAIVRY